MSIGFSILSTDSLSLFRSTFYYCLIYLAYASYSRSLRIYFLSYSKFYVIFSFTSTFILRIFALLANIRVDNVSPKYAFDGWIFANSFVIEFPHRESFKKWVSLESLKGICFFFFADSTSALITLPKQCSDLLILHPYFSRSPSTFVCFALSLPARSTILILERRVVVTSSFLNSDSMQSVKIVCDRELSSFMDVAEVLRFFTPFIRIDIAYS